MQPFSKEKDLHYSTRHSPATWASWELSWCLRTITPSNACYAIDWYKICCFHAKVRSFPGMAKKCHELNPLIPLREDNTTC